MNREKLIYQFRLSFSILKKHIQDRFDELKLSDRGYTLNCQTTPHGYRFFLWSPMNLEVSLELVIRGSEIGIICDTNDDFMVSRASHNMNMKKMMDDMMMFIDSFFDELEPEKPKWEPCKWAN